MTITRRRSHPNGQPNHFYRLRHLHRPRQRRHSARRSQPQGRGVASWLRDCIAMWVNRLRRTNGLLQNAPRAFHHVQLRLPAKRHQVLSAHESVVVRWNPLRTKRKAEKGRPQAHYREWHNEQKVLGVCVRLSRNCLLLGAAMRPWLSFRHSMVSKSTSMSRLSLTSCAIQSEEFRWA